MTARSRVIRLACVLVALLWAGSVQAQYLLTAPTGTNNPNGGALQIGTGLPLPVGTAGIFLGGMSAGDADNFPPLGAPPVPGLLSPGLTRTIMQDGATTMGGAITFTGTVLEIVADGTPNPIAVFPTNPAVFQVATTLDWAWPAATATLGPGLGPGMTTFSTTSVGGVAAYGGGANAAGSFGGAGQFAIAAGPGAGNFQVPDHMQMTTGGGTTTNEPIASVWINLFQASAPTMASMLILVGASNPLGVAAQGGATTFTTTGPGTMRTPTMSPVSTNFPGVPMGIRGVNTMSIGGMCTMNCMGTKGTVNGSAPNPAPTTATNMAQGTIGFPWTTGLISVIQTAALGGTESFFLQGTDKRVGGIGNISLVSSSLSQRLISGPNSNRGWLSFNLPEPTALLGAAGALGMLALCHGLVRRRSH